jgi:hypothetical protein
MISKVCQHLRWRQNRQTVRLGKAQWFVDADGQAVLHGGSAIGRIGAVEWISLFMHEAIPKNYPRKLT